MSLPPLAHTVTPTGGNGPHSGLRNSSFGVVTLAEDRFAGVAGSDNVVTHNLTVASATLTVTVDIVKDGGSVTLGVVGHVKPSLGRSAAITKSGTDVVVTFPGALNGLADLVGSSVQLSLSLKDAVVYTVGFR